MPRPRSSRTLAIAFVPILIGVAVFLAMRLRPVSDSRIGENALQNVRDIVAIGPRTPGSESAETTRQFIERELDQHGWTVARQNSKQKTPRGELEFVNLRARFGTVADWDDGTGLILLCSHYDTKFFDAFEFLGANDGGSSTGLLMELARVLAKHTNLARRVELVFFDGEEAFENYTALDGLYGSRHYARQWRSAPPEKKPRFGILLDMVGKKNTVIRPPADSPQALLEVMRAAAAELGHQRRFGLHRTAITDDHVPLNVIARIPTIDLIDMDYPVWHTRHDTIDQLSAESLQMVGETVLKMIELLAER